MSFSIRIGVPSVTLDAQLVEKFLKDAESFSEVPLTRNRLVEALRELPQFIGDFLPGGSPTDTEVRDALLESIERLEQRRNEPSRVVTSTVINEVCSDGLSNRDLAQAARSILFAYRETGETITTKQCAEKMGMSVRKLQRILKENPE